MVNHISFALSRIYMGTDPRIAVFYLARKKDSWLIPKLSPFLRFARLRRAQTIPQRASFL